MSANPVPAPEQDARYGEVFDRGYAHYEGARRGRRGAVTSLIGYSMKRAMGIRKSWTAKVMPFILYSSAAIIVIVFIALSVILRMFGNLQGAQDVLGGLGGYSSYFQWIFILLGLFVAICAPEMICVDRQERTLPLYFSRAITRADYVVAKIVAMTLLTMTMTGLPSVILWFGRQLSQDNARQAIVANISDLGKIILLSILVSVMLGTLGLMISSFTNRKGVAIAIILVGFLVITVVAQGLSFALEDYEWGKWFLLADLNTVTMVLSNHFFNDLEGSEFIARLDTSQAQSILVMLTITLVAALVLRWRYAPRDDA